MLGRQKSTKIKLSNLCHFDILFSFPGAPPRTFGLGGGGLLFVHRYSFSCKRMVPSNSVFSSDLGHLFFVMALTRWTFFLTTKKYNREIVGHLAHLLH